MKLEIRTPNQSVYTGEVALVQLPGIDGLFEILKSHAPLVSALKAGRVKVVDEQNQEQFFDIRGGVVEVSHDKILLLAE